jgi:hypothetical protein
MRCIGMIVGLVLFTVSALADDTETPTRWAESYNSGYNDENGAYAGGSEIMHLAAHKARLYAANGYWLDARWVIPPDAEKQSAQVLRLDAANGKWQVDLDTGKANSFGLRYMKGNILKSVTFARDGTGKPLPQTQDLLVMSAGARFEGGGAVSVWVRNDDRGTWSHDLVRHGPSAGGVRWVPRDMEVYRDKVTGVDRLFLLLGNPGVISGVYDASLPTKIRWDRHLEFPFLTQGKLRTRPLGIAVANGSLFFSESSSIYRRNDGEKPTYTKIINLDRDTDTDVGGIRGLTAIKNPKGPGQSLLLLWAPGGRSKSEVKRLDPDGAGGYTLHNEANMADLMSKKLGVTVTYSLGAHNMMYPVVDPVTKETVHIIGFQGNIRGKDKLRWQGSALYAGAMYAIRTADGKYSVQEVNNTYAPGKTVLVSPRAFCLSPFGDNQLFIGGHDSSNRISDDMAWIFKAPLEVALGHSQGRSAASRSIKSPRLASVDDGPIYELRIYQASEDRFQHLIKRFREHTDRIFKKHKMQPVGYWIPTDGSPIKRRRFVYVLKHPSRYAAYVNWNRFTIDREWQAVLKIPEFRGLLSEQPTSVFMTANDYSAGSKNEITKGGGIYELRTYVANADKLAALNDRFRDHTTRLFNSHGIRNVEYWTPFDKPASENTLIYLIHHANRAQADANWKAFLADPQWNKVARQSQFDGKLLTKPPDRIYLKAIDNSPLK